MSAFRALHTPICLSCRLRASIAAKQFARSRKPFLTRVSSRPFSSTPRFLDNTEPGTSGIVQRQTSVEDVIHPNKINDTFQPPQTPEEVAARARKTWGDALPVGELSEEEYRVYERLYGKPAKFEEDVEDALQEEMDDEELLVGTGVLKEAEYGILEEVEFEVEDEEDGGVELKNADVRLARDIEASVSGLGEDAVDFEFREEEDAEDSYQHTHPYTLENRFTTHPSTITMPEMAMLAPIEAQIAGISNTHLAQAAERLFGGEGLPYSTSTPAFAKTMQAKPIGLEAGQATMSPIEGDTFMTVLWPGMYASVLSTLTETRKRLGTAWAEGLVKKAESGELRILDAGGGGAGVLAVREMLRAEWERMHEDNPDLGSLLSVAEADGKIGGASLAPPLGLATVLIGSDTLRKRASLLLDNTAFVPRLPDYAHAEEAGQKGKFDLVIAPHTLWGLREDYRRKSLVRNLWSLVSQDGGVLLLLEKGVARGFEVVAGAREMLLESFNTEILDTRRGAAREREKGMIIAPCTTHSSCPMYNPQGMLKGRRDICHFSQRYIRPPTLQKILGARDKNFEDVNFSYLSIMRGVLPSIPQNAETTSLAFRGYENSPTPPSSLSLPRTILPPLKRHGHVSIDLCTPAGTLERWTVPKSFSKQAYRDARKSSWGDLWALGAKTRVSRTPTVKKRKADSEGKGKRKGEMEEQMVPSADEHGRVVFRKKGAKGEKWVSKKGGRGR